ncbi:MAG TPA: type II secretion system F family protein [Candidatus Paceibacterota bacterium]|nr:type II secretion system F family protein [Candidatus Paceibacterota bacterium]
MQFAYSALDSEGKQRKGTIDAVNEDIAIAALQRRNLIISSIERMDQRSFWEREFSTLNHVKNEDIVMISRQITTLFEAQVSALRAFQLLAAQARTQTIEQILTAIANDIQAGSSIADALGKHHEMFSDFYVNMVRAGEESGRLDETFSFLANYLDRSYEVTAKVRNALIYPAFVIVTFVAVMLLMMTMVIPKLASILGDVGQNVPIYTRVVISVSQFMRHYIWFILIVMAIALILAVRYLQTEKGQQQVAMILLDTPYVGGLYQKLYMSRIADNLATMLASGIQMVRGFEIAASVVGNPRYEKVMLEVAEKIKGGMPASEALAQYPDIPKIMSAMMKIGEETGNLGNVLGTMAKFYRREVDNAVDTLVGLIEPVMIVGLAVGVGFLLASVLIPIYNIAGSF